ncbi:alpha-N-methyltransferase NTM1 [Cantharellus anzutake]|uniref:alpha-N-methyltransferase NTM1 n=1 Tax=Cantharellus anzutake TaxID=1750568 RepID=UPI001908169F|nr:alpha-N-methyltransferase NTM1 [Cantharellus anzutake]KAF8343953.1 alpha-N-methyltransferase NTM1 [Cantharellus anzutake]
MIQQGLDYWEKVPASVDGVLGGFGSGSLPRVDSVGSRLFLLSLLPELCIVPSAIRPLDAGAHRRIRALDVGAGIGRVTSTTLLPLVSDVVLLEPVESFIKQAIELSATWRGLNDKSKSVTFLQGTLQHYDPSSPKLALEVKLLARKGSAVDPETDSAFDIIWCQWCLGHLSDPDLVTFFRQCRDALRRKTEIGVLSQKISPPVIIVKENVCPDAEDGGPDQAYDSDDASFTRSDQKWRSIFREAGLTLIKDTVQLGFPEGLYTVKM